MPIDRTTSKVLANDPVQSMQHTKLSFNVYSGNPLRWTLCGNHTLSATAQEATGGKDSSVHMCGSARD